MPRTLYRQQQNPDAYRDSENSLEAVLIHGRDAGAERRAHLRETHRRALERERAREQAIRAAAMPESEAAPIAQHRIEQERALTKRRRG